MLTLLWQTVLTLLAIVGAGLVCATSVLSGYTLQFLGGSVIVFLLVNRFVRRRHIVFQPEAERNNFASTLEVAIISFALLLAIGVTGGFSSWLLPLYLIYFLLLNFVCPLFPTLVSFVCTLVFFYFTTPVFDQNVYGSLLSLIVFAPIAVAMQKIYTGLLTERQASKLEREKVAYYNLYAERQQAELLSHEQTGSLPATTDLATYVRDSLIPEIDDLQKMSRFPENQLIISSRLTKLGLSLRQALKRAAAASTKKTKKSAD